MGAANITLVDDAQFNTDSFGDAPSGNITVTATTATINGGSIRAFPRASGPGGKIKFNTDVVQFRNGAVVLGCAGAD